MESEMFSLKCCSSVPAGDFWPLYAFAHHEVIFVIDARVRQESAGTKQIRRSSHHLFEVLVPLFDPVLAGVFTVAFLRLSGHTEELVSSSEGRRKPHRGPVGGPAPVCLSAD